jgi:hypothetical protein
VFPKLGEVVVNGRGDLELLEPDDMHKGILLSLQHLQLFIVKLDIHNDGLCTASSTSSFPFSEEEVPNRVGLSNIGGLSLLSKTCSPLSILLTDDKRFHLTQTTV